MINNALKFIVPVMAKVITDASIGPTHGVQSRPRDKPTRRPEINLLRIFVCPDFVVFKGTKRDSLENNLSRRT